MKVRNFSIYTCLLSALLITISVPFAFAQKGSKKYVKPNVVPVTKLSPSVQRNIARWFTKYRKNELTRKPRQEVSATAGKTAPAASKIPDISIKPLSTATSPAVKGDVAALQMVQVENTGLNLTGVQALAYYCPTWRQELGGMFGAVQLDAIEKAFAATDEWIFVRDENGELQARNKDEWDYTARFLTILNDSGINFTDKQIKQILGTVRVKGFTFNHYFTLKKTQAYISAQGHAPRRTIREDRKLLTLAELRKHAEQGDKEAADLATELELGKAIANALRKWPKDSLEYKELYALYNQNRNIAEKKTPQEIINLYKQWIIDHPGTSPRNNINENGKPLTLTELRKRAEQGDEEAADLADELELGRALANALQTWPKDSPEYKELYALYNQNRNVIEKKTPQEIINLYKQWIIDHPGTSPRMKISENGKQLTLTELRKRAEQGDKEAADLAAELELGQAIAGALKKWPKDSPKYQAIKALYDANRNSKTPQQIINLYKQWIIDHPGTSPRTKISENGKPLTLTELRKRAEQGDKEAADLATELELGIAIANALRTWPKDSPEYQAIKALYDANRNRAAFKPTNELYQNLVTHIKDYGHYPTWSESYLKSSIYNRLKRHQSTMVDGKYADPWLQKIYEITLWNERVKRGEITWDIYLLKGKRPRIQRAPSTQASVKPVSKPKGNETLLKEFNALAPQQQALLEEMFDKYAEAWENFGENWWKKTDENEDLIIHDPTTNTALQSVYKTVNSTTAFSLTPAENQRIVNILQRLEESELGDSGYYFTRLIYRGDTPTRPVAQDFHFVEESTGIHWNSPQGQTAKKIAAQTNTIRLYGDSEGFNEISLFPDVTQAQLERLIDALVPSGWEVRMGRHEVRSNWHAHRLHFHIEKVVDTSNENAADISITLNINFYRFAKGKNTAQTVQQLTQLLGKYLNNEGRTALTKIRY